MARSDPCRSKCRIHCGRDRKGGKARAIAEEAARRGRGGPRQLAEELGVSEKTISQAIARARRAPAPVRTLPAGTLERLLATELETVPPLTALMWKALAWCIRGTAIDIAWIEQPGQLLADEVEDAELDGDLDTAALAEACRGLNRVQALAVIDACQRDDLAALPVKE
ncbi:hypothetical protein [Streptomyces hygroscopicus]|uniref:hypothetical protein n=1 Tax=Streptomyces hygroscopicus TaxID=1912 RepID=UPI00078131D5|nr:hypothetical protein [Streptomyces hygroscopicus]